MLTAIAAILLHLPFFLVCEMDAAVHTHSFPSHLVSHSVDTGPSVKDSELGCIICFPYEVEVALIILISFTGHTNQRLTAADNHCLVLPVDP